MWRRLNVRDVTSLRVDGRSNNILVANITCTITDRALTDDPHW
jgi:hypothetical protein